MISNNRGRIEYFSHPDLKVSMLSTCRDKIIQDFSGAAFIRIYYDIIITNTFVIHAKAGIYLLVTTQDHRNQVIPFSTSPVVEHIDKTKKTAWIRVIRVQ